MKTKSLLYMLLAVLVFSFHSCSDDDKTNYLNQDELPEKVQSFLSEYLPNKKIVSAYIFQYFGGFQYIVQFKEFEVAFSAEGDWNNLRSEKGLPEITKVLLSEKSRKELNEKHPTAKVLMLTNHYNQEVEVLLDDYKKLLDIRGHEGNALAEELNDEGMKMLPEKMKVFISEIIALNTRTTRVNACNFH